MASKNIATEYTLPHLVIGRSPVTDVVLFKDSLKEARKKVPEKNMAGLFSEEESEKQAGGFAMLMLMPHWLNQAFGEIYGGQITSGGFLENTIGIYDQLLKQLFDSKINYWKGKEAISAIVEEEVHHQKYKDSENRKEKEIHVKAKGQNVVDILKTEEKIEEATGIKQIVAEIMQELPPLEKLLEPFYQRIGRK